MNEREVERKGNKDKRWEKENERQTGRKVEIKTRRKREKEEERKTESKVEIETRRKGRKTERKVRWI